MAKEKEKTVFEVLAPVVGLPPSGVEERFADFDASAIAAMQEAARKEPTPVATLRALFNAAARDAAKRLAEKFKATGPEPDEADSVLRKPEVELMKAITEFAKTKE